MKEQSNKDEVKDLPIEVLVAEDDDVDAKVICSIFEKMKIRNNLYRVNDGQKALDYVYHRGDYSDKQKFPRPSLILLDINMPKINGLEVLKVLKSDQVYRIIPTVILTSSLNEADVVKSYNFGANSFVNKPFNFDEFSAVVEGIYAYWHKVSKLPKDL